MTERRWMQGPPKSILLATDLSARCDRALDRAGLLETEWNAQLIALHVVEESTYLNTPGVLGPLPSWRQSEDPRLLAQRQLRSSLMPDFSHVATVIERGEPAAVAVRVAEENDCGLIVAGMARDEELGRYSVGGTVERLVRRSKAPVLIVKNRARKRYDTIVVTTDLSASSAHAIEAAVRLFPGRPLTVFHVTDAPFAGLVTDRDKYVREHRQATMAECKDFLATIDVPEEARRNFTILVEDGPLIHLLYQYVRDFGVELVVLGTHGRSGILNVLLGSVAKDILGSLPCDALVVREPRAKVQEN